MWKSIITSILLANVLFAVDSDCRSNSVAPRMDLAEYNLEHLIHKDVRVSSVNALDGFCRLYLIEAKVNGKRRDFVCNRTVSRCFKNEDYMEDKMLESETIKNLNRGIYSPPSSTPTRPQKAQTGGSAQKPQETRPSFPHVDPENPKYKIWGNE